LNYNSINISYAAYKEEFQPDVEEMIFTLYKEDPTGMPIDENKIKATLCQCLKHSEKIRLILIYLGDKLAGYAIIVFFWSNECGGDILCIDELFIKEDFRNRGIGSRFISDLPKLFPEAAGLSLEVTPSNKRAGMLYERLGFRREENIRMFRSSITE